MILIPQPALALNAYDAPGPRIRMWNSGTVQASITVNELMIGINMVAASTPNGRLEALILNCHGLGRSGQAGYGIRMGVQIDHTNVSCFLQIAGRVKKIYITACGAAHIASTSTTHRAGDGHYLMSSIARNAHAVVIAGTETQIPPASIPRNHIDSFEGLVAFYNDQGHLVRTIRRPSSYYYFGDHENG